MRPTAHTTSYRYEPPASGVIQILRMTPGSHDGQYVAEWQIDVSTRFPPRHAPGRVRQRHRHALTHGPIADLTINRRGPDPDPRHRRGAAWHRRALSTRPVLRTTLLSEVNPAMATFVREMRAEFDGDVLGFLHALMVQINEHMTFDEDPTNSGTSAAEAFALKRGVCQDYAHIFIACARSGGVPARFVSGHFLRSDGTIQQQAGHAWAEAFVPDLGWVGFDAGQRHLHHRRPRPCRDRARLPRRRAGARHPLWRRHGNADGFGQGRSGRTIGTVAEPVAIGLPPLPPPART